MKYEMHVFISDPNTMEGMSSQLLLKLTALFHYNPKQYGNGYYLSIKSNISDFSCQYDIRYDKNFNPDDKISYLTQWANTYWSGKNGAYKVDELTINKIEG